MAKKHDKSAKKPGNTVSAVPSVPLPGFESPEQFTANILRAFELSGEIVRKMVEDKDKRDGAFTVMGGLADAPKLFAPIAQYWMNEPQKFQAAQTKLNQDLIELWGRTYKRFLGEGGRADGQAYARRSALPGPRMDRERLLRFPAAGLSC